MLTWISGRIWDNVNPQLDNLRFSLGEQSGLLTKALQGFEHLAATREFVWDIAQSLWTKKYIHLFNNQEKATEDAINFVLKNYDIDNTDIIVVWSESWHAGLIGLIAGKIAEKFNKPTLCCTIKDDGYAKGSCRSVRDFNILDALKSEEAWALFKKRADGSTVCGGHAFAAGFELHKDNLVPLQKALDMYAKSQPGVSFEDKVVVID